MRKLVPLAVDGGEPEAIRAILEVEVDVREHADTRAAKVFEGMGIYSPTLGIIGAVLGLMAVMQNLADPSKLGHGIAAAFTATVYGIGLANLFFLPIAGKLKGIVAEQTQVREMVIEGIQTTIPLHRKIFRNPDFIAGRVDTTWVERVLLPPSSRSTSA